MYVAYTKLLQQIVNGATISRKKNAFNTTYLHGNNSEGNTTARNGDFCPVKLNELIAYSFCQFLALFFSS